jgi:uncharacterized membrane protein
VLLQIPFSNGVATPYVDANALKPSNAMKPNTSTKIPVDANVNPKLALMALNKMQTVAVALQFALKEECGVKLKIDVSARMSESVLFHIFGMTTCVIAKGDILLTHCHVLQIRAGICNSKNVYAMLLLNVS